MRIKKQNIIVLENVAFQYPAAKRPVVEGLYLEISPGECVVLTGESGCGKTTVTRIINGLAEKFYEGKRTGKAEIAGRDIADYPLYEIGKSVGSIFQDPKSQFFASITEDEVAFGCENYGVSHDELDHRVTEAVRKINGEMLLGREIYPMSSGEKQKIAVASVKAVNPKIYVFDEPSANLDMYSVEALKELMEKLKKEGHTIVIAEHRLYYLRELADRFIYMKKGKIRKEWESGEMEQLSEKERRQLGIRSVDLNKVSPETAENICTEETLHVHQLSFSYRRQHPIFNNISFRAYQRDIIAVVGKNGVGKTTLSQILCGMKKESSGEILYKGRKRSKRQRRKYAYFVMQNTDCQLFGDSVKDEIRLNGKTSSEAEIAETLDIYGMYEWRDKHPATLSGGQKQRLALAVSDQADTPILILDEPTSGLDFKNMQNISQHLKMSAEKGKTIFIITHDYEFAAMTCNKVLYITGEDHCEIFPVKYNLQKLYQSLTSSSN